MTDPASGLDVEALRADTPGCEHRIHLNNAGAGLMPRPVLDSIRDHLELEARIGGYEAADEVEEAVKAAYASVADLVGAHPRNVAFVENATVAFAQALSSIPFRDGDVILTTRNDYVSNQIQYLSLEKRFGVKVIRVPESAEGGVDVAAMSEALDAWEPRLVAVTHVPTNSGLVQDVAAVGELCADRDCLYLVDACQTVGQMPVSVEELRCDFLSATARKFLRGPRGAGFLFVSDGVLEQGLEPLFPDLHGATWTEANAYRPAETAQRFENWEFAYALVLGTGEAARYASALGLDAIEERCRILANRLRHGLTGLPGARILDRGVEPCAIVTVSFEGWSVPELVRLLRERGINTSSSTRAYAVLDFDDKGVEGAVRLSPHYYNTEHEVDAAVAALAEITGSG